RRPIRVVRREKISRYTPGEQYPREGLRYALHRPPATARLRRASSQRRTRNSSIVCLRVGFTAFPAQTDSTETAVLDLAYLARKLPYSSIPATGDEYASLSHRRLRSHQPGRDGSLSDGGPGHDRAIWRPLPDSRQPHGTRPG